MSNSSAPLRLSRREVIKWFLAASAAMSAPHRNGWAEAAETKPSANGYGTDPDLMKIYQPGDLWPLTLTPEQRKTTTALADVILPADDLGPAASALRVPEFIDEWVSAPYPLQAKDRPVILQGLNWIEAEAQRRFGEDFSALSPDEHRAICDDIAWPADAKPEFRAAANFFNRFRNIAAGAYYGTPEGWKAIGYVGNTPLADVSRPAAGSPGQAPGGANR